MTAEAGRNGNRRILWIHQNFVCSAQAGNNRPVRIIAAALADGWNVEVIAPSSGYLDDGESPLRAEAGTFSECGLKLHRIDIDGGTSGLNAPKRSYRNFMRGAMRPLKTILCIDAVYATTPPLPQLLLCIMAALRSGTPMILEIRDLWPARLAEERLVGSSIVLRALEWLESLSYHFADHIVVVAPAFVPYLERMGIDAERVTVAPTGGDPAFAHSADDRSSQWKKQHGLQDRFIILYAGSFNESYGVRLVLDTAEAMFEAHPEIVWVLAGNGRMRPQIEDASKKLENVFYAGMLARNDLQSLYRAADIGLNAAAPYSHAQITIPGKIFDYLASGLPVISCVGGQVGELLRVSGAGTVIARYDAESLAAAVLDLAALPVEDRKRMGALGTEWVLQNMNAVESAWAVQTALSRTCDTFRKRPAIARLLGAGCKACRDVITRRGPGAYRHLFGERLLETVQGAFQSWLRHRNAERHAPGRETPPIPILLSGRGDTPPEGG